MAYNFSSLQYIAISMAHHAIFELLKTAVFRVGNGSVTPRKEGFAKQTQVMRFGKWFTSAVTAEVYPVSIKLEALLERYSWKKVL